MSTSLFATLCALLVGGLLTFQVAANRRLGDAMTPLNATGVSFIVGFMLLVVICLLSRQWPSVGRAAQAPWWAWTGGLMGACYVASTILLLPRLGAGVMVTLVIAGQIVSALLMDHYGWLNAPHHPMNLTRLAGAALIIGGALLVMRW